MQNRILSVYVYVDAIVVVVVVVVAAIFVAVVVIVVAAVIHSMNINKHAANYTSNTLNNCMNINNFVSVDST